MRQAIILCGALAASAVLFVLDGPGLLHGRARTLIGTINGPDLNGPSEHWGLITYAQATEVYQNGKVVGKSWSVNTAALVVTITLASAVWVIAGRMALYRRDPKVPR